MTPEELVAQELAEALGDLVTFYFAAHSANLNVRGPQFPEYHRQFKRIYESTHESVDKIAELILKLGFNAPFSMGELTSRRNFKDDTIVNSGDPKDLALALRDANTVVIASLSDVAAASEGTDLDWVTDYVGERIDKHQKWAWQLDKSLDDATAPLVTVPAEVPGAPDEADDTAERSSFRTIGVKDLRSNPSLLAELRAGGGDFVERRQAAAKTEIRANKDGSWKLVGYASVFDSASQDLGGFTEVIQRGAFRRVLTRDDLDVRCLFNHDPNLVLARTPGTLTLREDPKGLVYEANVAPTTAGNDLRVLLERGDVTQSSFAFKVGAQEWRDLPDGTLLRTITEFDDLLDVSPVTYPAFTDTTAGARGASPKDSSTDSSEQDAGGAATQPNAQAGESSRRADEEGAHRIRARRQRLRELSAA